MGMIDHALGCTVMCISYDFLRSILKVSLSYRPCIFNWRNKGLGDGSFGKVLAVPA